MEKTERDLCETKETLEKKSERAIEEPEFTEALHGIIVLRKGKLDGREIWFGTVGNQLVSDGTYDTKRELIENLEDVTLDKVCKIVAGAFERAITYKKEKQ